MPENDETERTRSAAPPSAGVVSGMRPTAQADASPVMSGASGGLVSGPALVAVLSWLLALTMIAVDTMKSDFVVALVSAAIQAALIVAFFMRLGWDTRMHLLLVGVGALVVVLLLFAVSVDRTEYQPDLDQWSTTVREPVPG